MSTSQPPIPPAPQTEGGRVRGPKGRYVKTLEGAEKDAAAARLRSEGYGYPEIGVQLGMTKASAYEAVQRALQAVVQEPAEAARTVEVDRLDQTLLNLGEMRDIVLSLLERKHYTVSNGRLVFLGDEPLEDDGFVLSAVDRLNNIETQRIKVQDRRARLLGLDIPVKQEIDLSGGVEYRIIGVSTEALT